MTEEIVAPNKAILLLDDEPDIIAVFGKALTRAGYRVHEFTDPVAALEHYKANASEFGLIVSDVRMPVMSGIEFATEIRKLDPGVPIVFMSAYERGTVGIPAELKFNGYLQKPVLPTQLILEVSKHVRIVSV